MFNIDALTKKAILKCPEEYKQEFNQSKCSVTISVGQPNHEGDKFAATLVAVNNHFKECTIMVCDSLQRHTLAIREKKTAELLHAEANTQGEAWIKRNMPLIQQLDITYNISRWDEWLHHSDYTKARQLIDNLYQQNIQFREAVNSTALLFLERNFDASALKDSQEYLQEECAVMLLWQQAKYQFELYPNCRNEVMRFVYQHVIAAESPQFVREVSLKYKNKTPSTIINNSLSEKNYFADYEELFKQLPCHVYVMDLNNAYVNCNEQRAKALGVNSIKEVIGKKNRDMPIFARYSQLAEIIDDHNLKVMKRPVQETMIFEEEYPYINSEIGLFESHKRPILNKKRQVIGMLGISYDVTEQKEKLKEWKNKYVQKELTLDNIMTNLPGHLYWVDTKNIFIGCNDQQAHDLSLKSRHEIVGRSVSSFQTPENAATIIKNNHEVIQNGTIIMEEENFVDLSGEQKVYFSRKAPLKDKQGHIVGLLGISLDITEKKETDKLQKENEIAQKNAEVMNILSGSIAHEIRTPLSIIKINADLLSMLGAAHQFFPPEKEILFKEKVNNIHQAIKECTQVIDMLLVKLKKMTINNLENESWEVCSIAETVERALIEYPFRVDELKKIHYQPDLNFLYQGSTRLTKHILFNLLRNALYVITEAQKGEIYIEIKAIEHFNLLIFRDTALGISPNYLLKIFEKFQTLDDAHSGTGLGLAFCKLVMKSYGGDIECHSELGKFTEFILYFPRDTSEKSFSPNHPSHHVL